MTEPRNPFNIPMRVFILTMLLVSVGIVMVYSSSASYAADKRRGSIARRYGVEALAEDHAYHHPRFVVRQTFWAFLGLIAMLAAYRIDYHRLKASGPYLLAISFVLLLLVFVPGIGRTINDHKRWIGIGSLTFQPSELAKLALVIYMARMLTDHHDKIKRFLHGVVPALVLTGAFVLTIIIEPDIGAAAVLTAVIFLMWFVGGMRILHLAGLFAATIPAFIYVIFCFPDRLMRIIAFVNPTHETAMGKGYQLLQSLIAVGSGGFTGIGLGNSMQKYFLTEQYNDFIFAIICEEMGFVGAALIIFCFFMLIWEGWRVALRAPDFYAALLASGLTLTLTICAVLNLMVVLGLAPTKGLALPLINYGGSSLLVTMTSMGILMNIGKYIELQPTAERRLAAPAAKTPPRRFRSQTV